MAPPGQASKTEIPPSLAAEPPERAHLLRGFDTLGDDLEIDRASECDHRSGKRMFVLRGTGQLVEQRTVDFHFVDREIHEIGNRGEPFPEVVYSEVHAEVAQTSEARGNDCGRFDEGSFGDLDGDVIGIDAAVVGNYACDGFMDVDARQLPCAHVD